MRETDVLFSKARIFYFLNWLRQNNVKEHDKNETSNDNLNGLIRWDIHNTLTIIGLSIAETFHQLWFSPDI